LHLLLSRKYPYCLISQFGFELGTLPYSRLEDARRLFGYAAKVLFVSDRNKQVAERQLAKALDNAEIISNPVNLTDFSIVSYPQTQQIRFACVARLDCNFKGQDILLQTLSTPLWRQRDWLLNFYGKGPDEQFLKDLALFYKIDHKVRFCGHVSSIRSVWADNHIQIMPSIGEGTPLSLLEAMVCGRTAVVTDVGGNASMIEQEELGFLAAAASVQALDEALERAWKAKNQWQEMGEKAHQAILQKIDLTPELAVLKCLTECK
jgi:glycosyltransferase involved in cell wall biosynthesis